MLALSGTVNLTGYHLTFDDEFNTPADLAPFSNAYYWGGTSIPSNNEMENYVPSNSTTNNPYSVANGALTITASPTPSGGMPYTSGLLTTQNSFSQNTGYFEIRAEMPQNAGFWPAFWMLPEGAGYPEIDIMEQPDVASSNSQYWIHTSTPTNGTGGFQDVGTNVFAGYHTYGFMWTGTTIQYTFDGQLIGTPQATPPALAAEKMYLLANLAVGGWPPAPASGASSTYSIDYIRAYSNDPTVAAVTPEAVSNPDLIGATVGSGPDSLVLQVSEDAYQGDAQFTISVDGVQQGGTQTVTAKLGLGQAEAFTVLGSFGTSQHTVSVNFLNDAYGGSPSLDRNLYVDEARINGAQVANSGLTELAGGSQNFSFVGNDTASNPPNPPPLTNPSPVTIGTGTDQLVLQMSEDQYLGDAQFTVSVDGVQQGGTQTTTASHGAGQQQAFDVQGSFAPGPHTVSVNFLNDAYGGSAALDRNLYVNSATIDGTAVANASLNEYNGGPQSFSFTEAGTVPPVTGSGSPPAPVTIGSGPDTFLFSMAEDAYLGNAQFTISVDGVQQGGVQTTTALQSQGQTQSFAVQGSFGTGAHTETVNFLNDAYGGSPSLDRNLYVDGITYDSLPTPNSTAALFAGGPVSFATPATTQANPDTLTVNLTEDAYQGNATASISIDGTTLGTPTVTFLHSAGTQEVFTYTGDFGGAGVAHNVAVSFTNDAYGGSATQDRNLYVGGLTFDGTSYPTDQAAMFNNSTVNFSIPAVAPATKTS